MISRRVLGILLSTTCVLTLAVAVVLAVARLLAAMEDAAAAAVLDRFALGLGILWAIQLVSLVFALAMRALQPPDGPNA